MNYIFLIAAAIIAVAAVFEGAEAAFLSLTEARAAALAKRDPRAAIALKLKREPRKLLSTLLLLQTVLHLTASSLVAVAAEELYGAAGVGIAAAVMTFVVLVFANLIPKAIATQRPDRFALPLARLIRVLMIVFTPIVVAADWLMLSVAGAKAGAGMGEEDIRAMTQLAVQKGEVESGERELIERVFLFNDITAADVLTPSQQMVTVPADAKLNECLDVMNETRYSRYPVIGEHGLIIGIVHVKDILRRLAELPIDEFTKVTVESIATQAKFIEESQLIDDLFRDFKRGQVHMAIVQDKRGQVIGLITMEDLIEELVGEIADESDVDEHIIKRVGKRVILVHGDIEIASVNRFLNTDIRDDGHRTLGRLIIAKTGGMPRVGDSFRLSPSLKASVEQVAQRRLVRVRLVKDA
jgi:CBS domain containing-hemolysin-like protein